jgi:hypothetical protein
MELEEKAELANLEGIMPSFELKDSIKLTKNTKGYQWEIKLISTDLDELERINTELIKRFGSLT